MEKISHPSSRTFSQLLNSWHVPASLESGAARWLSNALPIILNFFPNLWITGLFPLSSAFRSLSVSMLCVVLRPCCGISSPCQLLLLPVAGVIKGLITCILSQGVSLLSLDRLLIVNSMWNRMLSTLSVWFLLCDLFELRICGFRLAEAEEPAVIDRRPGPLTWKLSFTGPIDDYLFDGCMLYA